MTDIDLSGPSVAELLPARLGHATGAGEEFSGFSELESVDLVASVHLAGLPEAGSPSLTLIVEHSDDGVSWETAHEFPEFTSTASLDPVAVDGPKNLMRARWTRGGGLWSPVSIEVRVPEANAPSAGGGLLETVVVPLTAEQLYDLSNDTTIELLEAPGPGKAIIPTSVRGVFRAGAVPFLIPPSGNPVFIVGWEELEDETGYALFCFKELNPNPTYGSDVGPDLGLTDSLIVFAGSDAPDGDFGGNNARGAYALSWFENQPLTACWKGPPFQIPGAITSASPTSGNDYEPGDTGIVLGGSSPAEYRVDAVSGVGTPSAITITSGGADYAPDTTYLTEVGGSQPGIGHGFGVTVTATDESGDLGDGILHLLIDYRTLDLPA